MKNVIQFASFSVLLFGTFFFGYSHQPTEMGLIILASTLSLAFSNIDKIQRFKGAGFEAEMNMMKTIIDKETEPLSPSNGLAFRSKIIDFDEQTQKVLKCLDHPSYTWRYARTVATETNLKNEDVEAILEKLERGNFVSQADGANGIIWGLTINGRQLLTSKENISD